MIARTKDRISIDEFKALTAKSNKKNKYNARHVIASDGTKCPSKKHAAYHESLLILQKKGLIKFFLREVAFDLVDGIKHRLDYLEFWENGNIKFVEVKGCDLALGKLKRKMTEEKYRIKIEVV